ncbi:MAG: protein kinase [Vulcanimicrobiota bacterium]
MASSLMTPERQPLARGDQLLGGMYRVSRLLGEGGFALTYKARQGRWNLNVCLKEFFPIGCKRTEQGVEPLTEEFQRRFDEGLQAFRDEAASLARFNHPGIVRVLGTFEENRTLYMVQEILEGLTLSDGITMAGKMKEFRVLRVAQQVGQALLMVHAAGLVHSDLKPENIFLTQEGRYVLLDFGLTRGFLSTAGAQLGGRGLTEGFAPPEQYIPGSKLGPATDVYSFAATLYCLLTGMAPPGAHLRSKGQPIPAIRPLNPTISERVERALHNALALDQQKRTPGIREFLYQLGLDSTPKAISYKPAQFEEVGSVRAHPTGLNALAIHAQTQRIFSGGRDGWVKSWSWPDLEALASQKAHDGPLSRLAVSEDGQYLVTGSEQGEIKLFSTELDGPGVLLGNPGLTVTSLRFKGSLVGVTLGNGECCLLGPGISEPKHWVAHAGPANCLEFHPNGLFLATGGEDQLVRFWELPDLKMVDTFKAHEKGVQSLAFTSDGTALLSAANDQSIRFWDLTAANLLIRDMRGHSAFVFEARFCCQDKLVISISGDHTLRGFDLNSSRCIFCSDAHNERTRAMALDPLRPIVASASGDGSIKVWKFENQTYQGTEVTAQGPEETRAPSDEADYPLVGQVLGNYHIVEGLGSGGMASVYKAQTPEGEMVALKVIRSDHMNPEFQQRFEREIRVSMKLDHPCVVRTLDWGQHEGMSFLVMELVDGIPLKKFIGPQGMDTAEAMRLLKGVVEGLSYAHSLGIVHRDVKPENVMIARGGHAKLMDFGLARDKDVKTVTKIGSAIGTAEYMAPEQILRGPERAGLTDKTDQYALGILVFEVLTGSRPFEWDDPGKLIRMHLTQAPPTISSRRSDVPPAVDQVVARMLHKEAEERYASVSEAGEALFAAAATL